MSGNQSRNTYLPCPLCPSPAPPPCTATATPQLLKTLPLFPLTIRGFTSQQLLYDITLRPAQAGHRRTTLNTNRPVRVSDQLSPPLACFPHIGSHFPK
ncbi:hypothetical protein Pmani_010473 [Petrolisthes manimaculis]|uniref:Uncharacterized protein n=1 Tax=Petrolisthes manimaculis TaxID=1843537 RepID=A0AAE1Q4E5_9EUCA|nr:hypothetical protein Pmani_010473 [Petrolisthes manimaculis]